mgnify:CR=1 FL=1
MIIPGHKPLWLLRHDPGGWTRHPGLNVTWLDTLTPAFHVETVSITKGKPSGKKFVATGHDNTKPSRSKVVNHKADLLKHKGYFIEVSGKIEEILKAKGVEVVDDDWKVT